jgi:actin-like ATPase involved in cell morphogenesis
LPATIRAVRSLRHGVKADFDVTAQVLQVETYTEGGAK